MKADLPAIPAAAPRRGRRTPRIDRPIRKPSGVSPWPITLLAGGPKTETARLAADASTSELIDRTLWLSWHERTPDAFGAIAGARFEIVEHDGTLDDFEEALSTVIAIKRGKAGRPHLIVVDGISQLWESVKDWGTASAAASSSASFWLAVNDRWSGILNVLRKHDGPVLLVARTDGEALAGHKDLPGDVDVLVELDGIDDLVTFTDQGRTAAIVTATRTEPPLREVITDFDVETVWLLLKLEASA